MLRRSLVFSLLAFAAVQQTYSQQTVGPGGTRKEHSDAICAWHGVAVADQLTNAIIYIWQGVKRCGQGHKASECSVDISYAIEAVQNTVDSILAGVSSCDGILTRDEACRLAWSQTVASMAGVAGSSSEIADKCPKNSFKTETPASKSKPFPHGLGMCIIDAKDLFWAVFRAGVWSADASDVCSHGESEACTDAILRATVGFASMGEFIAGIVGYCTAPTDQMVNHYAAQCSNAVLALIHKLNKLSAAGTAVHNNCDVGEAARLYLQNGGHKGLKNSQSNIPTLALALLPITAVMSFVLGRRMSQARQPDLTRDAELAQGNSLE